VATDRTRKCPITISSTYVASTVANYPFRLEVADLPSEAMDADGTYPCNADGADIQFFSDEDLTTELAVDVVFVNLNNNPALATSKIFVKIPSLSSTSDTTIWMAYNTVDPATFPAADSTYGSEAVWADYELVIHGEAGYEDAAGNHTVSTSGSPTYSEDDGLIIVSTQYAYVTATALGETDLTVQARGRAAEFKQYTYGNSTHLGSNIFNTRVLGSDDSPTFGMFHNSTSPKVSFVIDSEGIGKGADGTTTLAVDTWYHMHGTVVPNGSIPTYDGTFRAYLAGAEEGTNNIALGGTWGGGAWQGATWYIGEHVDWDGQTTVDLKDLRVRKEALGADWIATEEDNLSTAAFATVGTCETISTDQTVEVSLTTETDVALASSAAKALALAQVAEADSALSVSFSRALAIVLATGTDTALTLAGFDKVKAVGLATELDTALTLSGWAKVTGTGLATELDITFSPTAASAGSIGLSVETNLSQALGVSKVRATGRTTEADSVFAIAGWAKATAIGVVAEADQAFTLTADKLLAIALVAEADQAFSPTAQQSRIIAIQQVLSAADQAFTLSGWLKAQGLGLATEADLAQTVGRIQNVSITLATDTETAQTLGTPQKAQDIGLTLETTVLFGVELIVGSAPDQRTVQVTADRLSVVDTRTSSAEAGGETRVATRVSIVPTR